jgi:uncharacterized membrane protein
LLAVKHEKAFILNALTQFLEENIMTLETSKVIGGIGAILMLIGVFPVINYFGILEIIGAILILVGLHGIGEHFHEPNIFKNAIFGFVALIVGVAVAAAIALTVVWANVTNFIYQLYPGWNGDWASLSGMTPDTSRFTSGNFDVTTLYPLIIGILAVLVILWIFAIISMFFVWRSLKHVTVRTNVGLFGTAGLLLLIGAILIIAFGFGLILMWIGALLLAIAFFQLKHTEAPPAPTAYPPPPQTTV